MSTYNQGHIQNFVSGLGDMGRVESEKKLGGGGFKPGTFFTTQ